MKIQFVKGFESDTLDFQNGEFHRNFKREEGPFEVTDKEWATLRRAKYFELFTEPPPPPAADDSLQQEQNDQSQTGSPKRARTKAQGTNQSEEK